MSQISMRPTLLQPHLLRRAKTHLTHVLLEISIAAMVIGTPWGVATAVAQQAAPAAPRFAQAVPAAPAAPHVAPVPLAGPTVGSLTLEQGSGKVVALVSDATNVFVADPKVAEVRPASASTLFMFGVGPGHTTVAALDSTGALISQFDVTVVPSHYGAAEAQAAIARIIHGGHISVQPASKGLLLTGQVDNPSDVAQAAAIARGFLGENQTIENELAIKSSIQVTLQVRVAEMSRQVVRNLGVNWQALGSIGKYAALGLATPGGAVTGAFGALSASYVNGNTSITGVIDALAQDSLAHILAEPTLTVMSGQAASFLVGGEFPIPVSEQNGSIGVSFKNFGVSLSFVPTVFNDGRINIHVSPEVSSVSNANSVTVPAGTGSNAAFVIPSLVVQRAETSVELGSGQSFAIAGLLQDVVQHNASGLPFLGDVPILGPLFRSDAFNRAQTELVIIVTPYLVRPVNDRLALQSPDENYTPPGELDRLLLLHQTGDGHSTTPVRIPGDAGFVVQ
jgi:pilus assembly protein CpaC